MSDDEVDVKFGAQIEGLTEGIEGAKEQLEGFGEVAKTAGELLGIAFTLDAIKEFVEHMAELGEKTTSSMAILGVSAQTVGELQGIAKLTGTSFEGLQNSIGRMGLRLQESTRDAFNPAAQGLHALGISAKELVGLPTDQYLLKLAEAFGKLQPSQELTTAATAAFGRGITQQLPMLLEGKERFLELKEAVAQTGSELTNAQAKAFGETSEKIKILGLSAQGLGITLFDQLKPSIDGVVKSLTDMVQWFNKSSTEGGVLGQVMNGLTYVAKSLATGISAIISTLEALAATAAFAIQIVTFQASVESAKIFTDSLEGIGKSWVKVFNQIWHDSNVLHTELGKKIEVPGLDTHGKAMQEAQITALQEQVKAADVAYQMMSEHLSTDVTLHKITEDEKTRQLLAALDVRVSAEFSALSKVAAMHKNDPAEYAKDQKAITDKLLEATKERQKVVDDGVKAEAKAWQSALTPVQSAWDSQLTGLLSKTTTWAQAMKNIVRDLVLDMIKALEKWALEKAAVQLAASFGSPQNTAGNARAIAGDLGQAYAGFVANLAPTSGAAALAEAAALTEAAAAAAATFTVASADVGGHVVSGGLALIHPGEDIVPASIAQPYAGPGGGGGGGGYGGGGSITIQALDGADVLRVLTKHAAIVSRIVQGHVGANPTSFAR